MPQTLQQLINEVRDIINEPGTNRFTDTQLTRWINDACNDIARRAEDLITYNASTAVTAGLATYALPTGCLRVHRIEFVPTGQLQVYPLRAATFEQMDAVWGLQQNTQSSYPSYFVLKGRPGGVVSGNDDQTFQVQLYPVPASTGTLNIFYYKLPYVFLDPVANPTEYPKNADVPEGWWDLVVDFVQYRTMRSDGRSEWREVKQDYEEKMAELIDKTRQFFEGAQFFTTATGLNQPWWLVAGDGDY